MPWVWYEPTIPEFERANKIHLLHHTATLIGWELFGASELAFMPCLTIKATCGLSATDFVHTPCCMPLLSLRFSSSSQLTLCSPHEEVFTYISLSIQCTFSGISVNLFCCDSNGCICIYSLGERVLFPDEVGDSRYRGPGHDALRGDWRTCCRGRGINRRQRAKRWGNMYLNMKQ
jgi:hypothetical protein